MTIMIPFGLLLEDVARKETRDVTFKGHPLIPNDSFGLLEYYCPDPDCDCQMVMIGVISKKLQKQVATFVYLFNPGDVPAGMANPDFDLAPQVSYAKALLAWFAQHLEGDSVYRARLQRHYNQVRAVTSNPAHPDYEKYLAWESSIPSGEHHIDEKPQPQKSQRAKGKRADESKLSVPKVMQPRYEEIAGLTDRFCQKFLNDEYRVLCRKMAAVLARKRPSPLSSGKVDIWAAGIVYAIGQINFVFDKSQTPHIRPEDIATGFNVRQATASEKARLIRQTLKIYILEPDWTLPSQLSRNPIAWMIKVNGISMDARYAPREIQEEAYRRGLIPFIPDEK